jgi:hypothetical protein
MESVARKIEVKAVFQELARVLVVTQGGDAVTVRTAFADVLAKRAASCLLDPAAGDRVLLATEEGGDAYVLAVLEKADKGASTISVDGDLTLRSTAGRVSIAAQEGVDIVSAAAARIVAKAVDITGIEELSVLGGAVKAELGKVKLYASTLDGFFERIRSHAKNSHRTVEELDQVNARHIDYAAQESAHLRGENALVTAHHLVKVNGEQVHVG